MDELNSYFDVTRIEINSSASISHGGRSAGRPGPQQVLKQYAGWKFRSAARCSTRCGPGRPALRPLSSLMGAWCHDHGIRNHAKPLWRDPRTWPILVPGRRA